MLLAAKRISMGPMAHSATHQAGQKAPVTQSGGGNRKRGQKRRSEWEEKVAERLVCKSEEKVPSRQLAGSTTLKMDKK